MKIMSPMKVAAQAVGRIWMACVKAGRNIENGAAATLRRKAEWEVTVRLDTGMWMACVKAGRKIENGAAAALLRESRGEVKARPDTQVREERQEAG